MKGCPICGALAFDDAEVCYGCLYRYEEGPAAHGPLQEPLAGPSPGASPETLPAEGGVACDGGERPDAMRGSGEPRAVDGAQATGHVPEADGAQAESHALEGNGMQAREGDVPLSGGPAASRTVSCTFSDPPTLLVKVVPVLEDGVVASWSCEAGFVAPAPVEEVLAGGLALT